MKRGEVSGLSLLKPRPSKVRPPPSVSPTHWLTRRKYRREVSRKQKRKQVRIDEEYPVLPTERKSTTKRESKQPCIHMYLPFMYVPVSMSISTSSV